MEDITVTDCNVLSHMETRGDIARIEVFTDSSGDSHHTEDSSRQARSKTVTLRKDKRAISLGGGLNRLTKGLDEPDGDFPPEQPSFLHSKYAAPSQQTQSSYCLVDRDTQEEEEQRKKDKEKKKNRLSKGLMEFINMGDPLGYADKKLIKPFATLPPDEQGGASKSLSMAELSTKRQKDKKSFILSNDNTGSSNNGDHSDRSITEHSPPLLRVRRKNTESKDRRRTQEIQPKENEKVKAIQTAARSRKSSPIVLPDQELLTVPRLAPTTPVEVPPLPSGRTLLDIETTMDIDQLFTQLFTDCQWYRDWLFDPRRQVDTKNLSATDWKKNETSGLLERDLTYDRFQDFVITSATIKVSQKHTQQPWSRAGVVYGVDQRITNKGAPYADSFVITEHYRLTSPRPGSCRLIIVANVDFIKYSFVKGKIESESWAGLNKSYELLREILENNNNNNNSQTRADPGEVKENIRDAKEISRLEEGEKVGRPEAPTRISLYPENYQYTGQLILMVILLILTMLVISLFKLASTLEKIDQRLSNIEHIFQMR